MKAEAWSAFGMAWQMDEPFWGVLFASLPRSADSAVQSIGLGSLGKTAVQLAFCPDWASAQTEEVLREAIRHELCHLILGHPFRASHEVLPYFYNLASDIAVHRVFREHGIRELAFFPDSFPELRELKDAPTSEIALLLQKIWRAEISAGAESDRWIELERSTRHAMERHIYWPDLSSASPALEPWWMQWRSKAQFHLTKQTGEGSSWWREEFKRTNRTEPNPPWRQILRRFIIGTVRTKVKNTLHRPSKRYGTRPGIKISTTPRLWVAIDTSGSISQTELNLFFSSLEAVYRMGVRLTVLESDFAIRRRYPFTGRAPSEVSGRGGTRWDPVLEAAAEERPDGLIYFTDGLAAAPQQPCKIPVLWMITPGGIAPGMGVWNSLPGNVVKM